MKTKATCACSAAPTLIFPCSGASNVGELSDHAARRLTAEGIGKMYCLAGIGGRVRGIMETTRDAACVLAIDGCPQDCASKTLQRARFADFCRIRVTDLGLVKGESDVSDSNIKLVAGRAAGVLSGTKKGRRN